MFWQPLIVGCLHFASLGNKNNYYESCWFQCTKTVTITWLRPSLARVLLTLFRTVAYFHIQESRVCDMDKGPFLNTWKQVVDWKNKTCYEQLFLISWLHFCNLCHISKSDRLVFVIVFFKQGCLTCWNSLWLPRMSSATETEDQHVVCFKIALLGRCNFCGPINHIWFRFASLVYWPVQFSSLQKHRPLVM